MNRNFGMLRPLALAGLVLTLGACGTLGKGEPTPGDRMIARGEAVADLGKMWNDGRKMIKQADALASEGARLKRRGQYYVDRGHATVRYARAVIAQQEREYARFAETIDPVVTLETARDRQDDLDRVVDKWRKGWKRLNDGREMIKKGHSEIARAEARIAKAEDLRYRGRALMRRAEQAYNPAQPAPAMERGR